MNTTHDLIIIGALASLLMKAKRPVGTKTPTANAITGQALKLVPRDVLDRTTGIKERTMWQRISDGLRELGVGVEESDAPPDDDEKPML